MGKLFFSFKVFSWIRRLVFLVWLSKKMTTKGKINSSKNPPQIPFYFFSIYQFFFFSVGLNFLFIQTTWKTKRSPLNEASYERLSNKKKATLSKVNFTTRKLKHELKLPKVSELKVLEFHIMGWGENSFLIELVFKLLLLFSSSFYNLLIFPLISALNGSEK